MTRSYSGKSHKKKICPRNKYFPCSCWSESGGLTLNDEMNTSALYTISEQLNRSLASRTTDNIHVDSKENTTSSPSSNLSTSSNSILSSDSSAGYFNTLRYPYCPNFFDGCKEHDDENNPYNSMNYIDDVLTQPVPANEIFKHNNNHIPGRNIRALNGQPFRKIWKWCTHSISGDY